MPEIIQKDLAQSILPLSRGRESVVSAMLKQLQPGQALIVRRSEWKAKTAPTRTARKLEKRSSLKFETGRLPDNSGWILKRME